MYIPNTSIVYSYDDDLLPNNSINKEGGDDDEAFNNIILKTKKQNINKGWNDKNEMLIISIGENASSYKYMHERSSEICQTMHKIFKITLIIASTLLTVLTTAPESNNVNSLVILRYIITYMVTLLSVLLHFLQYGYLSERHNQAVSEFSKIYHDIQHQMCLYRRDRHIAYEYLSKILKKYDTLIMISPSVNRYVLNHFKKTFTTNEISIPEISKKIQKINIIEELPVNNSNSNSNSGNGSGNGNGNGSGSGGGGSGGIVDSDSDNNSKSIHINTFTINGDITDNDIECCNPKNIKKLRERFFKENSTYEYMRFLNNENYNI